MFQDDAERLRLDAIADALLCHLLLLLRGNGLPTIALTHCRCLLPPAAASHRLPPHCHSMLFTACHRPPVGHEPGPVATGPSKFCICVFATRSRSRHRASEQRSRRCSKATTPHRSTACWTPSSRWPGAKTAKTWQCSDGCSSRKASRLKHSSLFRDKHTWLTVCAWWLLRQVDCAGSIPWLFSLRSSELFLQVCASKTISGWHTVGQRR